MSPRKKFIKTVTFKRLAGYSWDAMQLASSHDPDLLKAIRNLDSQVELLERRLDRLGAPQYRRVK